MRKLFLASSFADCKELFSDFIWEDLHWKIVTFIPTAWVVEEDIFFIDDDKRAFESLWVTIDELEISTENIENIKQKLEKNDFIFVSWWNTFFLLQELKKTWTDKLILEQIQKGKPYISTSAWSIIMSPNIKFIEEMDDLQKAPELKNFDAFWLFGKYILPHYKNPYLWEIVENILKKNKNLPIFPITDKQVICIKGENILVKLA